MSSYFLLSFLFGAIVIIINAFNHFYAPALTQVVGRHSYPILNGVGVDRLSSPRTQTQGLIFYIGIYLVVYIAAIFFWELGEIVREGGASSGVDGQSGPQSALPTITDSKGLLSGQGDGRPLIVAMSMITIMSSMSESGKYLRVVEVWVRQVAHRLAGIPHGIYRLITRLNKVDYAKAAVGEDLPSIVLLDKARERAVATGCDLNFEPHFQEIEAELRVVDILRPSVHGKYDVFPVYVSELLKPLVETQKKKWDTPLDQILQELADTSEPLERRSLDDLAKRSGECSRNLKALFTILYRQTRPREITQAHKPTTAVLAALTSPDKYRLKDNAISAVILSLLLLALTYPLLDAFHRSTLPNENVSGMVDVLRTKGVWLRTAQFLIKCLTLFSVAWIATLAIRRALLDGDDYWETYELPILPFSRLIPSVFWPSVLSAFSVTCVMIIIDLVYSWDSLNEKLFADIVVFQVIDLPMNFFLAGVVSVAVLVVADQHVKLVAFKTSLLAGFFVLPFFVLAVLGNLIRAAGEAATETSNVSNNFSNALFGVLSLSIFALFALVSFAVFVEITERKEAAGTRDERVKR